jgi:O-antigen/teichoic acid export membrane protein
MVLKAGAISVGALLIGQLLRFLGNILLAGYLAPSAFGMVGIVNMILLGINLFSDIGLRQLVIQYKETPTREFLNTVWVVQIARGIFILGIAFIGAILIAGLQHYDVVQNNVYANPLVPALFAVAALTALINGFESTKVLTARRDLEIGRVTAFVLLAQICSVLVMVAIAKSSASPWALIAGAISSSSVQVVLSHFALSGEKNALQLDKSLAGSLIKKGQWILLASPLTFLSGNAEVFILGGLVDASLLGNYMIAFLLANVVHQVAATLSLSVFFPALSRAERDGPVNLTLAYTRYQLVADALIVTAGGFLMSAGPSVVSVLFDDRYSTAGTLLSALAIGLVGVRYNVIEQLMNAQGNFKFGAMLSALRLTFVVIGTAGGFYLAGLRGAAVCAGLSWFAGWPVLLWYRAQSMRFPWRYECGAVFFLSTGWALGELFAQLVERFHFRFVH